MTPMEYFRALSAIPRVSGNEKGAADFVESAVKGHGCAVRRDGMHNLIVTKPASYGCGNAPVLMLQGHLDMVAAAADGVEHDFARDPIRLVKEGDILHAAGTTLGADDGVAVACMLSILTDDSLLHPALECVFTVQEETGLLGALALDTSGLKARRLVNLDAGPEGVFIVTCAGGCRVAVTRPLKWENMSDPIWNIRIFGLSGGASGTAIDKQGANALVLAGIVADALRQRGGRLAYLAGGEKDNSIPSTAEVRMAVSGDPAEALEALTNQIRVAWQLTDPELSIVWERSGAGTVLTEESSDAVIDLLLTLPHGVVSRSVAMPGLVETSANLAAANTGKDGLKLRVSLRSSCDLRKAQLLRRVQRLAGRMGAECSVAGAYPGWCYDPDSPLRDLCVEVFREQYNREPSIEGIHAGLECGVLKGAMPWLDIVAMGPTYKEMHTSSEWLDLPSFERFYEFLKRLVERCAGE